MQSILLTVLLMLISLGGLLLLAGKLCLSREDEIDESACNKYDYMNWLSLWAVKLVRKDFEVLNTVAETNIQKALQIPFIQLQNIKLEG